MVGKYSDFKTTNTGQQMDTFIVPEKLNVV